MGPTIVILFVALGDANDPATRSVTKTTQEVLGEDSVVLVREVETMPDDDRAVELEKTLRASAVVELKWSAPDHREAVIRVHSFSGTWTERTLTFAASDAALERGRGIAFAVAAMVPAEPPPPPAPPPAPAAAPPPVVARPPVPEAPRAATSESDGTRFVAVDLMAHFAPSAGIDAAAGGGALAFAWTPSWIGLRASIARRSSRIGAAAATLTATRLALGAMGSHRLTRWFGIGGHLDLGTVRLAAERLALDGAEHASDQRWLPYGAAAVDAMVFVKRDDAFVLSIGIEHTAGPTRLAVAAAPVGTLPRTRVYLEVGVRLSF